MSIHIPSEIKPLSGYRLWLRFADGVEGTADLLPLVGHGVFQRWKDGPSAFNAVEISEYGSLIWEDEIDLCADALYLEISGKPVEEVFPRLKHELLHA